MEVESHTIDWGVVSYLFFYFLRVENISYYGNYNIKGGFYNEKFIILYGGFGLFTVLSGD